MSKADEIKDAISATESATEEVRDEVSEVVANTEDMKLELSRLNSEISDMNREISDMNREISYFHADFNVAMSHLHWQMHLLDEKLGRITEILLTPLDTQAKELRNRAFRAYKNKWYEEALTDLLESEKKNPYDFLVHQTIGHIYFLEKKDYEKAVEYYSKASKYAKPESAYHEMLGFFYSGIVYYTIGTYERAFESTLKGVELGRWPEVPELHYQHAKHCALAGKTKDVTESLRTAITLDKDYCLRVIQDKDFSNVVGQVYKCLDFLRSNARKYALDWISYVEKLKERPYIASLDEEHRPGTEKDVKSTIWRIKDIKDWELLAIDTFQSSYKEAEKNLELARQAIKRDTYFDCLESINRALQSSLLFTVSARCAYSKRIELLGEGIARKKGFIDGKRIFVPPGFGLIRQLGKIGLKKLENEVEASKDKKVRLICEFIEYLESEIENEKPAFVRWNPTLQTFLDLMETLGLIYLSDSNRIKQLLDRDKLNIKRIPGDVLEKQFSLARVPGIAQFRRNV